ncbi:MAG: DUF481 domain-containing protein [Flavobacteriales bacterium]
MFNRKIFYSLLLCFLSAISFSQSIVNTEKLFNKNKNGLQVSSELNGTSISGNASVFILGYSLNFSYKKNKSLLRLLSGGQYISQNKNEVSNSAFSQLRYDYLINKKSRYFMFTQLQSNAILLFKRRLLVGAGYRRNLINIERDSSSIINFDLSLGIMQEEEVLNRSRLPQNEKYYTNYTRSIFSMVGSWKYKKKLTVINTTYFQQYLFSLADYRLLNETNMLYKLNKNLSLSLDIEYRFDSDPPSLLDNKDLNSNLGLVIVF